MTAARGPEGVVEPVTLAVLRPGLWHRVYADHKAASLRALPVSAFDALLAERDSLADELRRAREALVFYAHIDNCAHSLAKTDGDYCAKARAALTPPREERP